MSDNLDQLVQEKAAKWLAGNYDQQTKDQVQNLIDNDPKELIESFYKDLEFGTGGLRGIMGVGSNRMNIYTVGMATQGLSNYLIKEFEGEQIKVAVAHDSRNNSRLFAEHVAAIFAANGFKVFLFDSLRPTPELSFAIRHLGCKSGVVVTASHNPKEYNGYKAYWEDGAQVTAPHDTNIIAEVNAISCVDQIKTCGGKENITIIGEDFDNEYLAAVKSLSLATDAIEPYKSMKIVYTPIHGTGVVMVPKSLANYGFTNVITVPEQNISDGNFPTVASPNPEERAALKMAIDLAAKEEAELVIATDPDADRLGIAVRDNNGEYVLLNGNQTCCLLTYYLLRRWSDLGKLEGKEFVIKTVVTSELMTRMAESFGPKMYNCLTGFKYIAAVIRELEGKEQYIGGGEESYGYLAGDFVRDKDAVSACSLVAEAAAWAKSMDMTLYDLLKDIYVQYGYYLESLVSIVRKGKDGSEQIRQMMVDFRANPPKELAGSPIVEVRDYQSGVITNLTTGETTSTGTESSNVLQFLTADATLVSVRPSGTEPKIKFYFSVNEPLCCKEKFAEVTVQLEQKIERLKKDMDLL